jgi:hypothetical protein
MRGLRLGLGFGRGGLVAPPDAINPDFTALSYTDNNDGTPSELDLEWSDEGSTDTHVLYGVTSTEATAPGADAAAQRANIIAGTGTGALEEFTIDPLPADIAPITGLTSTSHTATYVHAFIAEKNNGGVSAIQTVAVSGLDFTAPTFASATTSADGTTVTIDASKALFGTPDVDNAVLEIDGTPTALTSAALSSGDVVLTPTTPLAGGETYTVSYDNSGGELTDQDGNALTSFTDEEVTDAVVNDLYTLISTTTIPSTWNTGTVVAAVTAGAARKFIFQFASIQAVPIELTFDSTVFSTIVNINDTFANATVIVVDVASSASGNITITTAQDAARADLLVQIGSVPATATLGTPVQDSSAGSLATLTVSQTVAAGSAAVVGFVQREASTEALSRVINWSGATIRGVQNLTSGVADFAYKNNLSSGTETITSTASTGGSTRIKYMYSIEASA